MANPFTAHPRSVGETYLRHGAFAASAGVWMIAGGAACLVHAALPFLFQSTGSRVIARLAARFDRGSRASLMATHRSALSLDVGVAPRPPQD